jgi:UDP-3-O-[3-hydroxymyristoyl] N-acetylglucosamine deacetylase
VAVRAGHAMHTAFVSRLLKDRSAWELSHAPETAPAVTHVEPDASGGMAHAALAGA